MANPQLGRAPYDPRINVYDRTELRHWAREFGVSERRRAREGLEMQHRSTWRQVGRV
jgi:hypothetical protein